MDYKMLTYFSHSHIVNVDGGLSPRCKAKERLFPPIPTGFEIDGLKPDMYLHCDKRTGLPDGDSDWQEADIGDATEAFSKLGTFAERNPRKSETPESRGWVKALRFPEEWHKQGHCLSENDGKGWRCWQSPDCISYLCLDGIFNSAERRYFPRWQQIDDLLFPTSSARGQENNNE